MWNGHIATLGQRLIVEHSYIGDRQLPQSYVYHLRKAQLREYLYKIQIWENQTATTDLTVRQDRTLEAPAMAVKSASLLHGKKRVKDDDRLHLKNQGNETCDQKPSRL